MTRNEFIKMVESRQKQYRSFLTALCCGDSQLADDIAQESLIKAFLSIEGFRDNARFKSWLYRIGYTTFLNHQRGKRPVTDYDEAVNLISEETADAGFRYQGLHEALNRLTPTERTSLLLYYMEDYSVKEIAEIENVSQDAVKQHLSRGRRHLRRMLDSED